MHRAFSAVCYNAHKIFVGNKKVNGMMWLAWLMAILGGLWQVATPVDGAPINAANVAQLRTVSQIDFEDFRAEAGEIVSGWLRVSHDGALIVGINRANDVLLWDAQRGALLDAYTVQGVDGSNANMLDIALDNDGETVISLHTDGTNYYVAWFRAGVLTQQALGLGTDVPVRVWSDAADDTRAWLEVLPQDPTQTPYVIAVAQDGSFSEAFPSVAETDMQAQMRIGRMPAPLAVTADPEGGARLWDLQAGALLHSVQLEQMPMFGHMNSGTARLLAWRDPASATLNVLNFETGQNTIVADLGGTYLQGLLLGVAGDVVIGVNLDLQPLVVAWDVATGAHIELGEYRPCDRTPDMIQLSENGTTLVIGCNTGFDIWRIQGE